MSRKMNWKLGITLGVVVALMISSGGWVIGSNLGFKINKQVFRAFSATAAPKRDNWVSVPYNSPYTTAQDLCNALGISAAGAQVRKLNPLSGSFTTSSPIPGLCRNAAGDGPAPCCCPPVGPSCVPLPACLAVGGNVACTEIGMTHACNDPTDVVPISCLSNAGLLARDTGGAGSSGAILVGSSNETKTFPILRGGFAAAQAPRSDNWVSVPYHATWASAQDVCDSLGLNAAPVGQIVRVNADPAVASNVVTYVCNSGGAFGLVIGEGLLIRKVSAGDVTGFLPPHF